jgi:hypothetical protein
MGPENTTVKTVTVTVREDTYELPVWLFDRAERIGRNRDASPDRVLKEALATSLRNEETALAEL